MALSNLSRAGSKLVKAAALAISKLQAHTLTSQNVQQGERSHALLLLAIGSLSPPSGLQAQLCN